MEVTVITQTEGQGIRTQNQVYNSQRDVGTINFIKTTNIKLIFIVVFLLCIIG